MWAREQCHRVGGMRGQMQHCRNDDGCERRLRIGTLIQINIAGLAFWSNPGCCGLKSGSFRRVPAALPHGGICQCPMPGLTSPL
jgi:hypothetical protein